MNFCPVVRDKKSKDLIYLQRDRKTERERDGDTEGQRDRKTERQRDRWTETQKIRKVRI